MAATRSANQADLRLHAADLRLHPPSGWEILDRDGFVVHVDSRRQSPLSFALSVAAGLDGRPRRLEASFLYDAAGSGLFDRITGLPEYYLTRAEDGLLAAHAQALREAAGPGVLVELGSGASTKTWRLLDAWMARGPTRYVPIDVDVDALVQSCGALRARYPSLAIEGIGATYERGLSVLRAAPSLSRASSLGGTSAVTVAFLGSSLGNLGWREYPEFCRTVADALEPGDHFLVGLDLVKNPAELEAAYNDAAGVTAAFTRNLFARMNRELGTTIPDDAIEHVAFYDLDRERVEIFAEARREFVVHLRALDREFRIARGERILTEVSHKFRPAAVIATVEGFGFQLSSGYTGDGAFGLFLFRKVGVAGGGARVAGAGMEIGTHADDHLGALTAMRTRTLDIVAPLDDDALLRQHSPLMSPVSWDMGHIAHFEQFWLLPGDSLPGEPEPAMYRLYDPLATPRARRAQLPLPSVAAVRENLRSVRTRVERRLAPGGELSGGDSPAPAESSIAAGLALELALPLVVQHEAQHQETMLQAIALRDDLDYRPTFVEHSPALPGSRPHGESVLVPAGRFEMGTHDRRWAYDNERPAHEVDVAAFRMDLAPVTNQQYLAFMTAGGYALRPLWSEAGWSWLQGAGVEAPAHWRRGSNPTSTAVDPELGWARGWQAMVFGRLEPLHPDHPVIHVSFHEAAAYARFVEARLPTEAEWEKAAAWDPAHGCSRRYPWGDSPWEPARANLDQLRLAPTHAGAHPEGRSAYGCLQMLGDVWEWTDSWFNGYPGFESFPYREYSEIFFGNTYRVLRGGSFATRAVAARTTFRNWDLPERRQIFAGFRCVRSA